MLMKTKFWFFQIYSIKRLAVLRSKQQCIFKFNTDMSCVFTGPPGQSTNLLLTLIVCLQSIHLQWKLESVEMSQFKIFFWCI